MIVEGKGNLLTTEADALVNTVNTVGIMGKGVALQFKQAYPENFKLYERACRNRQVQLGRVFVTFTGMLQPRLIINFPTKEHWRAPAKIDDIRRGLVDLIRVIREEDIRSIAMPPLGCGLGGLRWEAVRPLIYEAFQAVPQVEVILFAPGSAKAPNRMIRTAKPGMTAWIAALIKLVNEYAEMGFEASHHEAQKLVYFLHESGEPFIAHFAKGDYGPYDQGMRHALIGMDGHYVHGFGEGRRLDPVTMVDGAIENAEAFLLDKPETRARVARVTDLIEGFESPYGLELLATVHWVATREQANSEDEVVSKSHAWNPRKAKSLDDSHLRIACRRLKDFGWIWT